MRIHVKLISYGKLDHKFQYSNYTDIKINGDLGLCATWAMW